MQELQAVLPACAGVIPDYHKQKELEKRITRMRGGDPTSYLPSLSDMQYYPHARG